MRWLIRILVFGALSAYSSSSSPGALQIPDHLISVGIVLQAKKISFIPEGDFVLKDASGRRRTLKSGRLYRIGASAGGSLGMNKLILPPKVRLMPLQAESSVRIGERRYGGSLIIRRNPNGTVSAIDELSIESYLLGVLPYEVDPNWPIEALKAQAVVARTFSYDQLAKARNGGYDLTADTRSQVFGGIQHWPAVEDAVRQTRGEVLGFKGELLDVYYHACCGGHTEDASQVWGGKSIEPLRGVKDKYCKDSPYAFWRVYLSRDRLLSAFRKLGVTGTDLEKIKIEDHDSAGYVKFLIVKVSGQEWRVRSSDLRRVLDGKGKEILQSARISKIKKEDGGFEFEGSGSGHGVGFCQWGARFQAKAGRTYEQILKFYFPGSVLSIVNE